MSGWMWRREGWTAQGEGEWTDGWGGQLRERVSGWTEGWTAQGEGEWTDGWGGLFLVEAMRQSWRREDTAVRDALGFNPKRTADRRTDPSETDGGSRDDA